MCEKLLKTLPTFYSLLALPKIRALSSNEDIICNHLQIDSHMSINPCLPSPSIAIIHLRKTELTMFLQHLHCLLTAFAAGQTHELASPAPCSRHSHSQLKCLWPSPPGGLL